LGSILKCHDIGIVLNIPSRRAVCVLYTNAASRRLLLPVDVRRNLNFMVMSAHRFENGLAAIMDAPFVVEIVRLKNK